MAKFYATLCIKDGGGYVTIEAENRDEARIKMLHSKYDHEWAFLYDEAEKPMALDRFNMVEKDSI